MLRFSNRLLTTSALGLVLGAGVAQAQKFAIIDMQQAVLTTTDGKKAAQAINVKFSPIKVEIDQLTKDIQAKQDAFTKNRATQSAAAAAAAQQEIETLTTNLKRKQEDAQQDLDAEENKQLGGIVPKLQQIINQYAAANQISFVIDTSANPNNLIFGDSSLNIIAPVVTAYEKALGGAAPAAPSSATPPPTASPATPSGIKAVPRTPPVSAPKTTAPGK